MLSRYPLSLAVSRVLQASIFPQIKNFSVSNVEESSRVIREIVESRTSCRKYVEGKKVPDDVLKSILAETLVAPTARNWQPFKIVTIMDEKNRSDLGECMALKNSKVLKSASGAAVFLADSKPIDMKHEFSDLWKREGMDSKMLPNIFNGFSRVVGAGGVNKWYQSLLLRIYTNKKPVPLFTTNKEWSYKNSAFPMMQFVLSCEAYGLSTIIIEGFDGRRVSKLINCPKRYAVCGIVIFGYSNETGEEKRSLRYDPATMVFEEKFNRPFFGIPELRTTPEPKSQE